MTPWLLHIGYPKCGSTWLQKRLFPVLAGVEFLGKRYEKASLGWTRQVRNALGRTHCFDFSSEEVHRIIRDHAGGSKSRPRLLSFEGLSGDLWRGAIDSKRNADRIKQTFPEAKILMVIRRQPAHLESIYKQYLLMGGVLPMHQFLTSNSRHLHFDLNCLQFHRLAEHYIHLYGRESVKVLPFELLAADIPQFCDEISDFFGSDRVMMDDSASEYVRKGFSARHCALVRRLNVMRNSTFIPTGIYKSPNSAAKSALGVLNPYLWAQHGAGMLERVFGAGELLNAEENERIRRHFEASNQRLATLYPELRNHGYLQTPQVSTLELAAAN